MQEMQKMRVQSLGGEDPLEEEMATHSSILTVDREAWRATVHGVPKSGMWLNHRAGTYTQVCYPNWP